MKQFKDFMFNGSAARSAQEATRQASQTADELGLPCAYNKSIHKEPPSDATQAGESPTPMLTRQITMPK